MNPDVTHLTITNLIGAVLEERHVSREDLVELWNNPHGRIRLSNGFDYAPRRWEIRDCDYDMTRRCKIAVEAVV